MARVTGVEAPSIDPPPPAAASQTRIGKGPKKVVKTRKAKVKFALSSPNAATFQYSLSKLKGEQTTATPFKACTSPKRYKLVPGRYRFQVRAVSAGVPDPTPAARKFKIVRIHD
ncbi:MAG TPA: hypothetical protein VF125_04685 [Solirubrobacterales bacterium]